MLDYVDRVCYEHIIIGRSVRPISEWQKSRPFLVGLRREHQNILYILLYKNILLPLQDIRLCVYTTHEPQPKNT